MFFVDKNSITIDSADATLNTITTNLIATDVALQYSQINNNSVFVKNKTNREFGTWLSALEQTGTVITNNTNN